LVHPNIVGVLDYGEDGASSYLVMERLPGSTLRDEISRGPVAPDRLVVVVTETLAALAAAHRFGVLHRDIKPSNILLQDDGHAKITDFGIAKSLDGVTPSGPANQDLTMTGVVLGTPGYLAPERRSGHPATVQSDLYSVGAVMVEALAGRSVLSDEVWPVHVASPLREVAARAMAPNPGDRFPSADAMIEALRTSGRPSLAPAPLVATAALVALAAVALVALFLVERTTPRTPLPRAASQHTTQAGQAHNTDAERTSISQLAASLAAAGQPGDGALAAALGATAAQSPGPGRQAAADQTLALAQVLLAGGGITDTQYQDVANVLAPTGATAPANTAPANTAPANTGPPTTSPSLGPPGHGHHHHGGQGESG
jgi:hypothetical protein